MSISKSLTLEGNNAGTPGDGSRAPESIVDGEDGIGVDITTTETVTVDGFEFVGDEGVVRTGGGNTQSGSITIQNNRFLTNERGAVLKNFDLGSNGVTLASNFTDLTQGVYTTSNDRDQASSGSEIGTVGIELRTISGTGGAVSVTGNDFSANSGNESAFYGIIFDGVKPDGTSSRASISGGTIDGTAQAIAILDGQEGFQLEISGAHGDGLSESFQSPDESFFNISGVSATSFTGSSSTGAINQHNGIFVFTGGEPSSQITSDGTISNVTMNNTGTAGGDGAPSAGLYFGGFSAEFGNGDFDQNITVTNATVQGNDNRGVFARGSQVSATVERTSVQNNGANPANDSQGNPLTGVDVFARQGATLEVVNCFVQSVSNDTDTNTLQADNFTSESGNNPGPLSLTVRDSRLDRNGAGNLLSMTEQSETGDVTSNISRNAFRDGSGTLLTIGSDIAGFVSAPSNTQFDVSPFLTDGMDQDPATNGFQGDFSTLKVTLLSDQLGSFGSSQRIAEGIDRVDTDGTVNVESGTFDENVVINKSVTLEGNNAGTPGDGSRSNETVVTAGSGSIANTAVTIKADDVTIDGFRFTGSQGVVLNGANLSTQSDWVGATVQNNLVETNLRGVRIENLTTTASKSFTVQDNQFAIQQQEFVDPTNSGNDAGDQIGEQTIAIYASSIDGADAPSMSDNVITDDGDDDQNGTPDANPSGRNDGAFYGYALRGAKVSSGPVTISGGSVSGTLQGIAILDGQIVDESDFRIENVSMDQFAGVANNSATNFHAGVFVYTGGGPNSVMTTTGTITGITVEETDVPNTANDPGGFEPSADIYFGGFSDQYGNGDARQDVTVENVTVRNNVNRGVFARGLRATATVTQSTIEGNGADPASEENSGLGVIARRGASLTVENSFVTNPASQTNFSVDALQAQQPTGDGSDNPGTDPVLTVTDSKIDRNANGQFMTGNGETRASGNAWLDGGTLVTSGSTITSNSSGSSNDFTPLLENGSDQEGGTPGFQGDFSSLTVTAEGAQLGSTGRIGEGIDRVDASGTVNVESGTYAERVTVDKGVTLSGPNAGVDAVDGSRSAEAVIDPGGGTLSDLGVDVTGNLGTVEIDGFKIQNYGGGGIIMGSSDSGTTLHVRNNIVDARDDIGKATIQVAGDNSTVIGNDVEAGSLGDLDDFEGAGILVAAAFDRGADVTGVVVRNNDVHGGDAAIGTFGDDGDNGEVDAVKGTTVERNTITNNKIGVNIEKKSVNTSIRENIIENNDVNVQVEHQGGFSPTGTQVLENKVISSANLGAEVRSDDETTIPSDYVLNISANWWGTTDESTISSSLTSESVDVTPFLDSGSDTDTNTPGFQGDFSTLNVTAVESQSGSTGRISEGNNRIDGGGTVNVTAGTYTPADVTVQENTVLESGADVSVSNTLTLSDNTFNVTNGTLTLTSTSETSTAAIAGSGSGSVNGDVTFERYLDNGDDATHFRFLSSPTATKIDDEGSGNNVGNLLSNMWTQSQTGQGADVAVSDPVNSSVYTFDETVNLNGSNLSSAWTEVGLSGNNNSGELNDLSEISGQENIDPGRGLLTLLYEDWNPTDGTVDGFPITLSVTGSVQSEENSGSAITPPITYNGNDSESEDGWNLIANPFMAPIDWDVIANEGLDAVDATIYVWDAEANQFASYTAGGGTGGSGNQGRYIAPFQAFFVKATGNGGGGNGPDIGGIDSDEKAVAESPEVKETAPSPPTVALELRAEGDSTGETTAFRFTEEAAPGKDAYDAYQLKPLASSYALVASEMASTNALFDHQNRPVPAEVDTINLALDITVGGTYTLGIGALENFPSDWNVLLENTETGTRYDVDAGETVTFDVTLPESSPKSESSSSPVAAMLENGEPTVATAKSNSDLPSFRLLVGPSSAIPVELASFDATTKGTEVRLSWQTASETNNAGFAIERKTQDGAWSQIGFREGAGTTSEAQTYRFTDAEVPFEAEQVRYRLRQKDLDGTTTLSDEVTVELSAPSKARLHAPFPNPAAQRATLRYEVPKTTTVQIAVYDVLGRRVETVVDGQVPAGRAQTTVQTGQWAPGAYFVRMQFGDTVRTERLSVVR